MLERVLEKAGWRSNNRGKRVHSGTRGWMGLGWPNTIPRCTGDLVRLDTFRENRSIASGFEPSVKIHLEGTEIVPSQIKPCLRNGLQYATNLSVLSCESPRPSPPYPLPPVHLSFCSRVYCCLPPLWDRPNRRITWRRRSPSFGQTGCLIAGKKGPSCLATTTSCRRSEACGSPSPACL